MRGHGESAISKITQWLSTNPALTLNLFATKGSISVGKHADLVLWDPEGLVETTALPFIYPEISPFTNEVLFGKVFRTYLRGQCVYSDNTLESRGQILMKEFG
jgi:allantoinase